MALITLGAGRATAQTQEIPPIPEPDPTVGYRVVGPLLSARSPSQNPVPPPSSDPGPFQAEVPGSSNPPLGDAAGDGPEPVPREPLLVVPPSPPPLPALPPGETTWPASAFGTSRTTQIEQPVGPLGEYSRWFNKNFLWGDEPYRYVTLPSQLLWEVPLANPREPRMYGKFFNLKGKSYIDTAIGAQFGLGRIAPKDRENEGIQLDVFAAVFTRFDPKRFLTSADYRAGIPLTYRKGPWSTKLSYEHTSTHIGDEYSQAFHVKQVPLVLDEAVFGVSRYFGSHFRIYGQSGYAFNTAKETNRNNRTRFDFGASYLNYTDTGPVGRPYAGVDVDIRSYQSYQLNTSGQIGWQWVGHGRSVRLGLEGYHGRSPYGQFYKVQEQWFGFAAYYDW